MFIKDKKKKKRGKNKVFSTNTKGEVSQYICCAVTQDPAK